MAKFKADGTGQWLELSMRNPVVAANPDFEFKSDADIAIFTRLAADAVGATRMDRPEWAGVNPRNGEVYITLTTTPTARWMARCRPTRPIRAYTRT